MATDFLKKRRWNPLAPPLDQGQDQFPSVQFPATPALPTAPPDQSAGLAGEPDTSTSGAPVVNAAPVVSAARPDVTLGQPATPTPPTMVEVPSDRPKGFKDVLKRSFLGMIPGYTEGYEGARAQAQRR